MYDAVFPRADATALLVVDVQERLLPGMGTAAEPLLRQTRTLIALAGEFNWPVIFTEQYPRGLGATETSIAAALTQAEARRYEKVEFSACRNAAFAAEVLPTLPASVVVVGMETHICVLQTVADLQARGVQVFVPADAVASRTPENRQNGLDLIARTGAVITNTETLLFGALQRAGTDAFKRLSPLIR